MTIFFSAGEPSGDVHGANLIRALRARIPGVEIVGYGGPEMAAAGCKLHEDLTKLAVMWFLRVILNIHKFLLLASRADRYFRHHKPDAVVLIDYPGFNWWVAKRAKAHKIPVFYYAPPQIWAWGSWRVKKMRRFVDHVLAALPFEARWFREQGCHATFVGHPYFDEVRRQELDQEFIERMKKEPGPLVTILPGSRTQEVEHNLRYFLESAERIRGAVSGVRFAVAAFKPHQAAIARDMIAKTGLDIPVFTRKTPELIRAAECCMAVSGSVSLELLYQVKPTVILYWIPAYAYWVQERFRHVKYITLVNLLATDELYPADISPYDPNSPDAYRAVFPEYLTFENRSEQIARHIVGWLLNPAERNQLIDRLRELKQRVGHGGASRAAAEYIASALPQRKSPIPRPHFLPDTTWTGIGGQPAKPKRRRKVA
jgi:lipid-A-disaccharide synthase